MAKLPMKNSRLFGIVTDKMVDRVMHFVHLATILVKDEDSRDVLSMAKNICC